MAAVGYASPPGPGLFSSGNLGAPSGAGDGHEHFVTQIVGIIGATFAGFAFSILFLSLVIRWRRGLSAKKRAVPDRKDESHKSQKNGPTINLARSLSMTPKKHIQFTLRDLNLATNKFDEANVLGEGGFGKVYRGVLPSAPFSRVAIKVLRGESLQGLKEFVTEIELLSRLDHKHLVRLLGHCIVSDQLLLVYRHVANGSLADHLHGKLSSKFPLEWAVRLRIALGAALGIQYLHTQKPQVLHRDIKAANILLTRGFNAKVCDFGFAKQLSTSTFDDPQCTPSRSGVIGTMGYVAPESLMTGEVSDASDVYSFGVVLLELLSGRKPLDFTKPDKDQSLVTWARSALNQERISDLVDPTLLEGLTPVRDSVLQVLRTARLCLDMDFRSRPSISEVVQTLQALKPKYPPGREHVSVDFSESDSASDGGDYEHKAYDGSCIPELHHFTNAFLETNCGAEGEAGNGSFKCMPSSVQLKPKSWVITGFSKPPTPTRG